MHVLEFRNLRDDSYRCELCGQKFNTQSALQQHINKAHTPRNNADGSNETFKYEEYLMNVFNFVRYKCQYCGLLFITESDLEKPIKEFHTVVSNGAGSGGSFKYKKHGTTCGEPFNVDQNITHSEITSCKMFSIFEQLRTYIEKSEELNSVKKTYEECFEILKKIKCEENIKGHNPKNKHNNEAEQQQDPAGHQEFSPASEEKNL
ncbi:putative zinc finger protein 730 [Centruroides sculpturatus]|uniref:putative zinc finger protein 730 n=1 Tax=Centruroides sculpturatus TaxID=218467 RepID=UPI000C6EE680|nr:putative zinc finger protein 730 [Centruroides sculpturatus]XP_023211564.1 putative zinc finger protein 730 [Centruroides sculpturatus]